MLQVWDSRVARMKIGLTKGPGGGAWRGRMGSTTHKANPGFFVLIRSLRVFEPSGRPNLHALRPRNGPNRPSAEAGPAERAESACLEGGEGGSAAHRNREDMHWKRLDLGFFAPFLPLTFVPNCFGHTGSKGPSHRTRGSTFGAQSMKGRPEVRRRMPT